MIALQEWNNPCKNSAWPPGDWTHTPSNIINQVKEILNKLVEYVSFLYFDIIFHFFNLI